MVDEQAAKGLLMALSRTRKQVPLTAATVALLVGATACGGGTGGVADQGGGGGGGGDALTLWHMEQPANRVEAWQALIDRYNQTDPEFPVEQQVQDWNQIYTKIAGAVQSNTQPDILFAIPVFTTFVRPLGKVRAVTDVVEEIDGEHR